MIQHQVNHDAGNRDIKPHRQSPTRDSFVSDKVAPHRATNGNDDERHDDGRKKSMGSEYDEINWSRNSLPREPGHAVMLMIDDVRNQEHDGRGECRDLTGTMGLDVFPADEKISA